MKQVKSLRQLQQIHTYIYRDLRNFCNKNELQVYMHGGTLIGAIRHQGFIPWDDDIDVCMSRPDYEKMMKISKGRISDKCTVIDPNKRKDYNGVIPVIAYNESKVTSKQFRTNEELKIAISIFIYDGITENKLAQKIYYTHMYLLRAEHALCRADFAHANTKPAKLLGPILMHFYNEKDIEKFKKKILKLQQKYSYNQSKYISTNVDYRASREVCTKQDFERAVPVTFEGIESFTYSHYDTHLRKYYGDYMQLPPKEQQIAKHNFDAWIDDDFDFNSISSNKSLSR